MAVLGQRFVGVPALALAASGDTSSARKVEIVLIDGETFTAGPVSIGESEATFRTTGGVRKVPMRNLWRVRFAQPGELMERPGGKVITLLGGGMVGLESIRLNGGKITTKSELLGNAAFELSSVETIYLPKRNQRPDELEKRCEEMSLRSGKYDYLVAEDTKGDWIPVPGVLKTIEPEKITFRFEEADRTVGLEFVRVIKLARISQKSVSPAGRIIGRDGSAIDFTSLKFNRSKLSVMADGLTGDAVNLPAVAEIRFRSDRFVYLSGLKPAGVAQAGLFGDVSFPYRRDLSSAGSPLRIGKKTYARGLGMHSRCELTYNLDGKFILFAAEAGIDNAGGKRGDATLKILGDGTELLKPTNLTGGKDALPVRCDVTGVKKLTILVDFGADGIDAGDHVDLGEARLVKK